MNRSIRYLCVLAGGVSLAFGAIAFGQASETAASTQAEAKLAEVRGRIAALTSRLGAQLADRDALAARVRDADLSITAKRRHVEALHAAEVAAVRRRGDLGVEQARDMRAIEAQRAALASQVRAAYLVGQQAQLTLLLNQSDPALAGRMLVYYGYFARERGMKIEEIRTRIARLQQLVVDIDAVGVKLRALQVETTAEMADLERARAQRAAAYAAVDRQVGSDNQELAELKREEQAEEALVADLARVLQDFPVDTQQSFESLRGKLPWPVPGKVSSHYQGSGASAANTAAAGPRRNGVLIDGARGAKVRAPYFGRVVYADWLQGLGLLLIIGHSGGYMTLYGHAEVLYKSVGDWVAPGDVIAALGDVSAVPQLYFEIREGRKAVDPKLWMKSTP